MSLSACSYYPGLLSPLIKSAFQQFLWEIGLTCASLVLCPSKSALCITFFTSQVIKLVDQFWSQKVFRQGKILIKSTLHENNCLFAICSGH